jgi:hypothetical protein
MKMMITSMEWRWEIMRKGMVVTKIFQVMMKAEKMLYMVGIPVHGYCACIRCMDDTTYHQLQKDPGSSKTVFLGHQRWLRKVDPWRKRKDLFNGKLEL